MVVSVRGEFVRLFGCVSEPSSFHRRVRYASSEVALGP